MVILSLVKLMTTINYHRNILNQISIWHGQGKMAEMQFSEI